MKLITTRVAMNEIGARASLRQRRRNNLSRRRREGKQKGERNYCSDEERKREERMEKKGGSERREAPLEGGIIKCVNNVSPSIWRAVKGLLQ